ncbi:hypothetical protein [Thermomonas sp.]|uniref:hypothetical protein n=1 Tax=Thermomonas sp. TaxID=1971895 RepID=UPI00260FB054|nr:hypothetical protein [Thermomonas sp.]
MNRLPPEPLDAEERALTAQLPRVRGRSEPTPELDAQILAAARAAQAGPVSPRKPRRWQVPFALAASLCLAVGLAWQLRQTPSRHTQMDRARPVATAPATSAAAESTPEAGPIAAPARDSSAAPPPAPAAMPVAPAPVIQPRAAMEAARPSPAAPPDNPADAAPALPQARPAPEFAPPPPPPPAPAAAPPATIHAFPAEAETAEASRSDRRALEGTARQRALSAESASGTAPASKALAAPPPPSTAPVRPAAPPPVPSAQASRAAAGSGAAHSRFESDDVEDDLPPATMDSPAVREAWLRRIAELAHAGRLDEARASLKEFRRRYPNEQIPAILHKLEQDAQR